MLKERDRDGLSQHAADEIHPAMNASAVLGTIRGAADADALLAARDAKDLEQLDAEAQRVVAARESFAKITRKAWEHVLDATPNKRVAEMIVKADRYLGPDANVEQLTHVGNHVKSFERDAADFLMRGDYSGLDSAITTFWNGVQEADKLAPPKLPLMPSGDMGFYGKGWSGEQEIGLRNIVAKSGDRCISIGRESATLVSGRTVSRKEAADAYAPPAGGKMFAVGSLGNVQAAIQRRAREQS